MKRILLLLSFCFLLLPMLHAQKVGLVLSGGGAKGMTHIGIIRALEENNIPIDYITGTSMGAIIGSLYAMGYSPDDMEALLRSEDFKRWYSGKVEPKYAYYFKKSIPTPEFFNIRFDFKDSLNVKPQLPTSMVNPIQMNLVFVELFARATAACDGDFDRLFVPFRCIASDVYNKRQIVLGKGDLGDAVRASMSFPFVFKPIEIDSVLAYDGGIYNNFPTDVMRDDFHPDIIIGSVVAANPSKPKENDLMRYPPRSPKESIFAHKLGVKIAFRGIVIAFMTLMVYILAFNYSFGSMEYARSAAFTVLVVSQLCHVFDCRSEKYSIFEHKEANKYLYGAVLVSIAMQLAVLYVPFLQGVFQTKGLDILTWAVIIASASIMSVLYGIYRKVCKAVKRGV